MVLVLFRSLQNRLPISCLQCCLAQNLHDATLSFIISPEKNCANKKLKTYSFEMLFEFCGLYNS